MKRSNSILYKSALFSVVLLGILHTALPAGAQATYAATARQLSVTAGALGSAFQPNYTSTGGVESNPDYLFGVGAYVDVRLTRWIQIEGESRWLRFNPNLNFNEANYLIGLREPLPHYRKATPYAKVLYGLGTADFLTGNASSLVFGGGVDYKLSKKFSLRAIDFEYQRWKTTPTLKPYGFSVGIGYKIF
jgi:hypothetical protein